MKKRLGADRVDAMRTLWLAGLVSAIPAYALEGAPPEMAPVSPGVPAPATQSVLSGQSAAEEASKPAQRRGGWHVVPSVSLEETFTDNVTLAPADRKRSDLISVITPAIRIEGDTARAKLSLNYHRQQLFYARDSDLNNGQNFLNALGTLEAVERWLFIDAGATITQQSISAFAPQTTTTENVNQNRAETSTYYLSPHVTGRLGLVADYDLRYTWTTANASGNALPDQSASEWTAIIKSSTTRAAFGWSLDGSRQAVDYGANGSRELNRYRGSLIYHVNPELLVLVNAGREATNYVNPNTEEKTTYGAGFEWAPSPRTRMTGLKEQRFFGDGHDFSLVHRTPLSAWQYTDSKNVTLPSQLTALGRGTAFDVVFAALASRIPDPVLRAQEVERLLQQSGTPANLGLGNGFLTTRAFIQHSRQASVALLGVRNTITFAAALTKRQGIGAGAGVPDDFTLTPEIEQRALSASWAHRLTARSAVNLLVSHIESKGAAATNLETTQSTIRVLLTHQFSPRTAGTLGLRYVRFDGNVSSNYVEKAVTASVSTRF